tara:strand:+ start:3571 stop:3852 length:282 start_codon:yes stop_codon:yes gene_type:complete
MRKLVMLMLAAGLTAAAGTADAGEANDKAALERMVEDALKSLCIYRSERYSHGAMVRVTLSESQYCWTRGDGSDGTQAASNPFPVWRNVAPGK